MLKDHSNLVSEAVSSTIEIISRLRNMGYKSLDRFFSVPFGIQSFNFSKIEKRQLHSKLFRDSVNSAISPTCPLHISVSIGCIVNFRV